MIEAINAYFEKVKAMSPEEKKAWFDEVEGKNEPKCDPKTCGGECQGMGWCQDCEDFWKKMDIK